MKPAQTTLILETLKTGKRLTPLDALTYFGCFRLAARVKEIRAMGYEVKTSTVVTKGGKRVAEYYL